MNEESLFELARNIPAAERAALLDRECAGDAALRARVEALLVADADPGDLTPPTVTQRYFPPVETEGTVLAGKYRLTERIGEGGMGSVWLAQQSEPVKRKVAVKLIKPGMDSRQVLARFEAERQALALMDHPNIAKVLDGGLHDGRPFFVMELVKGVPITEYCDARKLTPRERLELFIPVCQAIQHAHQKGVIHRDIKPSNVLIALYDDHPVPKVIDFGVAKATGGTLTEHTIETGFGGVVGTPQYMSPEQATFNNLDIDTRSDVYALGVLLYELLTGSPPFSKKDLEKRGLLEMLRVVREEQPPRPSTKLSTADTLPTLSANRGTEPKKLTGLLRNELDWIVMKALEKDRSHRYETANGFAADVQRHLAGEPVVAHPPTVGYRLRKYYRKHQTAIVTVFLVAFMLKSVTLFSMWQASRAFIAEAKAEQQRDEALTAQEIARQAEKEVRAEKEKAEAALKREAEERQKAEAKEAEANAVVQFFQDQVFAAARPKGQEGGLGASVTLRDAIAASEQALDKGFPKQPLVEARLRLALGTTFNYLAEHDQARIQYERARALYTQNLGPDHPDTLKSVHNLANSYGALNRPSEALKLREEVLAIRKRVLPEDHPDTLKSLNNLAASYADLNRPTEALKLKEEVLAIRKRVLPPDHPDTLRSMNNLAISYAALNRPTEALTLFEEVLAIQKRVLPKDHPDTLASMSYLAVSYEALNRPTEALKLREEVLPVQKQVLPKDHPDTLTSMNNLANSYEALHRPTEALKLREEVLAIHKRVLPKDHPDTLTSMNNLAISYAVLNRHAETLPLVSEVLEKGNRPGVDPRLIPSAIGLRLQCYQKANDPAGCRATAEMWEKLSRPDAGSLYTAACCRAVTAAMQARTPGAEAARLAKEDAGKAMAWLTKAVAAGYKDAAHIKKDADLDFLRDRDDFKKLLADLEKKSP